MKNFVNVLKSPFTALLQTDYGSSTFAKNNAFSNIYSLMQLYFKKAKRAFKNSPQPPVIIVIVLVGILAFFSIKALLDKSFSNTGVNGSKIEISKPIFQQKIDRTFNFPLKDSKGKEVSKLAWTIQTVELRDEIIVKGQRARSVKGRVFLIVNLKITNTYSQAIAVNTRDYLRFIINGSSEKLAADIHNDPVDVQAISTKYTRLGLPINETDKNVVLQIGEITGNKELIKLNLK